MSKSQKRQKAVSFVMPDIPNKLYFTIGEVAKLTELKPHVLRFWETEFKALSPVKRKGNRRYYTKQDIQLILRIKSLLYQEGFTIEGARLKLKKSRAKAEATTAEQPQPVAIPTDIATPEPIMNTENDKDPKLAETVANLESILNLIEEDVLD